MFAPTVNFFQKKKRVVINSRSHDVSKRYAMSISHHRQNYKSQNLSFAFFLGVLTINLKFSTYYNHLYPLGQILVQAIAINGQSKAKKLQKFENF